MKNEKFNPKELPKMLEKKFDEWWNGLGYESKFEIYQTCKINP